MKHIVNGFRQEKLIKFSLDFVDTAILRYFIDFKKSGKMVCKVLNGNCYYWVSYEGVLKELPMLNMKKYTVQSRFFKLRDLGILTHIVVRQGGTYSYFGIGENYKELITRDTVNEDETSSSSVNEEACNLEENFCSVDKNLHKEDKNARGHGFKSDTNNPSTKYPSIKNIKNTVFFEKTAFEIIEYLNLKTEKNFKSTTKATTRLIKARLNEGFTVEDFKTVIDNMKSRWTGTKFQQYLAPTTLFGNKSETYLNQGDGEDVDGGFKRGNVVSGDEKSKAELDDNIHKAYSSSAMEEMEPIMNTLKDTISYMLCYHCNYRKIISLLNRGGMLGMMETISLAMCALCFGGLIKQIGCLDTIIAKILTFYHSRGSIVLSNIISCIAMNFMVADQYMAIVIPGQMYKNN